MATLYDPHGRPVAPSDLRRDLDGAVAKISMQRRPWSGGDPRGFTPARLGAALRSSGDTDWLRWASRSEELDPHWAAVIGRRRDAVSGIAPYVEPGEESPEAEDIAAEVQAMLDALPWDAIVTDALDGLSIGWSAQLIRWDTRDGRWTPAAFEWFPPWVFQWSPDARMEPLIDPTAPRGRWLGYRRPGQAPQPLEPLRWMVHRPRLRACLPVHAGLARLAAWTILGKTYSVADWLALLDGYGTPLRLGRYDSNASPEQQATLLRAVRDIGPDAGAIMPASMQIEFVDRNARGAAPVFEGAARYLDEQLSKLVTGATMTVDAGSSRSQAEVHERGETRITRKDATALAETVNRDVVRPYVSVNRGVQRVWPRVRIPVHDPGERTSLIRAVADLAPAGLRIPAAWVRRRLGMPDPEGGEETITPPPGAPAPGPAGAASASVASAGAAESETLLDEIEARALDGWRPQLRPLLDPVRELAASARDEREFRAGLARILSDMDDRKLARGVAAATFTARGLGDARDEP